MTIWERQAHWCRRAEASLRAGSAPPRGDGPSFDACAALVDAGVPVAATMAAGAIVAEGIVSGLRQRAALVGGLRWRLALCLVVAAGVRCLHMQAVALTPGREDMDAAALTTAAVLVGLARWWLNVALPPIWMTLEDFGAWTQTHAAGTAQPGRPAAAFISLLTAREAATGVSLTTAKRAALVAWCERRRRRDEERLQRLQDLLPLVELAGGGVAAVLLLVVPFLATLQA